MLKLVGTILGEAYTVTGETYTKCRGNCAKAYIDTHKLNIKPTNLMGLVSLRADKPDKGEVLLGAIRDSG